jgi:hypothetical protein
VHNEKKSKTFCFMLKLSDCERNEMRTNALSSTKSTVYKIVCGSEGDRDVLSAEKSLSVDLLTNVCLLSC